MRIITERSVFYALVTDRKKIILDDVSFIKENVVRERYKITPFFFFFCFSYYIARHKCLPTMAVVGWHKSEDKLNKLSTFEF